MADDLRELDCRVARDVMGWEQTTASVNGRDVMPFHVWVRPDGVRLLDSDLLFSSDIAAAFRVVERMRERGCWLTIHNVSTWRVEIYIHPDTNSRGARGRKRSSAESDSLPEAICRAALAALEAANVRQQGADICDVTRRQTVTRTGPMLAERRRADEVAAQDYAASDEALRACVDTHEPAPVTRYAADDARSLSLFSLAIRGRGFEAFLCGLVAALLVMVALNAASGFAVGPNDHQDQQTRVEVRR